MIVCAYITDYDHNNYVYPSSYSVCMYVCVCLVCKYMCMHLNFYFQCGGCG